MSKFTRRFKKNKQNKTFKRGGAADERQGIFDLLGDKISNIASSAAKTVADASLKIAGLERIDKNIQVDGNLEKNVDGASEILSNVENIADKTGAVIIDNFNDFLGSNAIKQTTAQSAKDTAEIVKESAEVFNEALNDPVVKAELEEAVEKAGEVGAVLVKAAEKPFEEVVDVAAKAIPKATGAALSGAIKVGTDAMAAVPGVGAVIEVGKMLNDGTKAASAVVEAGSEAVEAASDAFVETKANVERGLKELEEKKKLAEQISNRTTRSIDNFENPISTQIVGGRKTRRRLFKRKAKSKRVRFAI